MRLVHTLLSLFLIVYIYSCAQCIVSPFDTAQGGILGDLIISSFSNVTSSPNPPSGLTLAVGNAQTVVSWNSVSATTRYNLYYSTSSGITKASGTKISDVTSPYSHTGLTNGSTYYYLITSVDSRGEGTSSEAMNVTPISPVAVGGAGAIYYTLDGRTWISKTIAGANTLYKVIHDGTNYIAVGGTGGSCVAYYSSDGVSWSQSTGFTCNSQLNDLTYGKGILVATGGTTVVAASATTYTSSNHGVTFTVNSVANASSSPYTRIAFDGNYFIAGNGTNPPTIYRSTTGSGFVAATASGLFGTACTSTGYFGDLFHLQGTSRVIFIGAASGCGSAPVTSIYTDNSTSSWTNNAVSIFGGNTTPLSPNNVALGGTRLVAVGQSCKIDYSDNSSTSLSWNYNGTMTGCSAGTTWNGVTYDNAKFIAVGTNGSGVGVIATSTNGSPSTWTISTTGGGSLNAVSWK